jgi:plasmid maintenance system antidote protein VapI
MNHALLDRLLLVLDLKNTRALAKHLQVTESSLSKIRAGERKVTGDLILAIYDKSGMSLEAIRGLAKEANGTNT